MTVKELKERLELLIEDDKEDYTVYVFGFCADRDTIKLLVDDIVKEVYL